MCLRPVKAIRQEYGRPLFHPEGELTLPCGKCPECISLRASDYALRVQHELGDHDDNCCLTLTYDQNHIPNLFERQHQFQLFMKKLRERSKKKLLYLCSHEYGSKTQRLHHHALIFGLNFPDMKYLKTTPKQTKLYTSRNLSSLWTNGWSNIGEASVKAGYYIAAYALKSSKQELTNSLGEIIEVTDTMSASKRPAIGLNYLRRNHRQLVMNGERLPRYYKKKMEEILTMPTLQALSLSAKELRLRSAMLDSLVISEGSQDYEHRSPRALYNKYQNFRSKLQSDSDFREKLWTKHDNAEYDLLKSKFYDSTTLELNNGKISTYSNL